MKLDMRNHPECLEYFQKAFDVCCEKLGIQGYDWTVRLRVYAQAFGHHQAVHGSAAHNTIFTDRNVVYMRVACTCSGCGQVDMLDTFCHEMAHVKQIVTGQLQNGRDGGPFLWEGKEVNPVDLFLADVLGASRDHPWEKDAEQWEMSLAATCRRLGLPTRPEVRHAGHTH